MHAKLFDFTSFRHASPVAAVSTAKPSSSSTPRSDSRMPGSVPSYDQNTIHALSSQCPQAAVITSRNNPKKR
jgi:hypothetical protein